MSTRFLQEILEQPQALRRSVDNYRLDHPDLTQLAQAIQAGRYDRIILTGMGSSLHSCYPLWLSLNVQTSIPAALWDASELTHFAPEVLGDRTLLIVVSQSGESAEIKRLTRLIQQAGLSISLSNGLDNTLARWADVPLDTHAGAEASVSTKTYITTLAVLRLLGDHLTGQDVGSAKTRLYETAADLTDFLADWQSKLNMMSDFLGACETLAFIGRGPSLASVSTGALITSESSKIFCVGLSAGQFRHGPLELVRSGFNSVIFAGNSPATPLNEGLAREIGSYGGKSLLITPGPKGEPTSSGVFELPIPQAEPDILPILEIVPVQLLTITLARARGFEPATFVHASKVTGRE